MKKLFKMMLSVVLATTLCFGVTGIAYASEQEEVKEISTWNDLKIFLHVGGKGVLTNDIVVTDDRAMLSVYNDAVLDLNGHNVRCFGTGTMTMIEKNLVLVNTKTNICSFFIGSFTREDMSQMIVRGSLSCKNVNAEVKNVTNLGKIIVSKCKVGCDSMLNRGLKASFENTYSTMTTEQFIDMALTGDLPTLDREGFVFNGWEYNGKNVTSTNGLKGEKNFCVKWKVNTEECVYAQ